MKTKSAIRSSLNHPRAKRPGNKGFQLSAFHGHRAALTVLEMLVSVSLLVVIVVGLTAMFVQTQRAFKAGVKQTTVTDAGHAVLDMVAEDLSQISDAQNTNIVNLTWGWWATNTSVQYQDSPANVYRTNQLQYIFALVHTNTQWMGVGYAVSNCAGGAGTLYRFFTNTSDPLTANDFTNIFIPFLVGINPFNPRYFDPNYFHRVADGVVHLKIFAFDQFGNESPFEQGQDYAAGSTSFFYPVPAYTNRLPNDSLLVAPLAGLPATIQLEVGILEPEAFDQLRALPPNSPARVRMLGSDGGKIQIYRQNIPIAGATR